MRPKISVIIPCYNCGKYVERCLDSIISQSYENLEIIIVNDGSTDNTENILMKYLNDSRVKYIKRSNGGEAAARNTGIDASTGELIGFVDSDDYIHAEMYEKLYSALCDSDSDMAVCNYNQIYDDGTVKPCYSTMSGNSFCIQDDVISYWMKVCSTVHPNNYVWSRLYRKELITSSSVRFEGFIHSADTLFNFKLLPHMKKCVLVNEGLYNYVQRAGSGIHTVALKKNIAELYADTFQALADYYTNNHFDNFKCALPIHAYTRMKNVFFYSRLAGLSDDVIISNLFESWKDRDILKYFLGDII